MSELLCLTTCPDRDIAIRVARTLVEERLAACVNILPGVTSIYAWQGAVHQADELQLIIKTTRERFAALKARLPMLHPYDVPELVAVEVVDGLPAYLEWMHACVRPAPLEAST